MNRVDQHLAKRRRRSTTYILLLDLRLLLRSEVVDNVEELTNLFRCLTLNHICNSLASNIAKQNLSMKFCQIRAIDVQQRFDIEVVSGEDDLEEHLLINGDELLVPLANISCPFSRVILVRIRVGSGQRLALVVLAIFEDLLDDQIKLKMGRIEQNRFIHLLQNTRRDVGKRDGLVAFADICMKMRLV